MSLRNHLVPPPKFCLSSLCKFKLPSCLKCRQLSRNKENLGVTEGVYVPHSSVTVTNERTVQFCNLSFQYKAMTIFYHRSMNICKTFWEHFAAPNNYHEFAYWWFIENAGCKKGVLGIRIMYVFLQWKRQTQRVNNLFEVSIIDDVEKRENVLDIF